MQNCRTAVTGHTFCYGIITGEQSDPENFEKKTHTKLPLIMPKMLFSDMHILKIPRGPDNPTPSRSAPVIAIMFW